MSAECGLCEVSLRQSKLIETCDEARCPYRKAADPARVCGPDALPLSEMSYREMIGFYHDDEDDA
ncbi:hypothetical protein [Methylobacterium flocculans]|uniref:hypothetical protein n=1 Tax=Methylobacterium flocculans TaxID=2984843 RepID=UPI0021F3A09A|nr:hypothetical protein [Methylobacterium sp. FF17]